MKKRKILKPDGRYLIFYEFEPKRKASLNRRSSP